MAGGERWEGGFYSHPVVKAKKVVLYLIFSMFTQNLRVVSNFDLIEIGRKQEVYLSSACALLPNTAALV